MSVGKLTRYGLPHANVVADGTATNNITPGRTLEKITHKLGGTALTKAMIQAFKVKANGKVIVDTTGTQLQAINAYRGAYADAAFLDLFFADYSMLSEIDRMVGAFDTSLGINNITTEVKIAGATAPVLTQILLESQQQKDAAGTPQPYAGYIAKLLSYPFNIANGGKLPVSIPFGKDFGALVKRIHVFHGGNMTGATVKQDGMVVHESLKAENEFQQKDHGRVPQANVYTLDFVLDGNLRKALDTRDSRSLELLFDFSAADNGTVIVEYIDPLGNL